MTTIRERVIQLTTGIVIIFLADRKCKYKLGNEERSLLQMVFDMRLYFDETAICDLFEIPVPRYKMRTANH